MSSAVADAVVEAVGQLLVEEIGTTPEELTELWADRGGMLPRLLTVLKPRSAVAVVDEPQSSTVQYHESAGIRVDSWASYSAGQEAITGVLPWRWAAERAELQIAQRTVTVVDDPAHIALLAVCRAMPIGGVAVVVAGLGFVVRPGPATVMPQFEACGLALSRACPLPGRMFTPRSATGRLLITIRRVADEGPVD